MNNKIYSNTVRVLFALLLVAQSTFAIKIVVPDQYKDQVEELKQAEREKRQRELQGGGDATDAGDFTIAASQEPMEAPAADEFLVQSVVEATATATEYAGTLAADEGLVSGQIVDKESGEPLSGVAILVEGSDVATVTAEDGRYSLGPVAAGQYTLTMIKGGYIEANVTDFSIAGGEVSVFPFALPPRPAEMSDDVYELQDFSVTAEEANDMMALIDLKQASIGQVDFLSSEDFAKFGGSSVADFVNRLAGVNVVEGQFAVVRGMGDRYNSTLLNSLPVPSPDPVRQGVQLDLFPTSVIESVVADKAFVPVLPSNSSGAAFNLLTRAYPDEFNAWLETGVSVNENSKKSLLRNGNVKAFQGTPGGKTFDVEAALGRDDVSPAGTDFAALDDSVGDGVGDFGGRSYKFGFGDSYATPWGGTLGFISSINYSSSSKTSIGEQEDRYGEYSSEGRRGRPNTAGSAIDGVLPGRGLTYDFTQSTVSEDSAYLFGVGASLDPEDLHRLDFTYLRSKSIISEASRRENGYLAPGSSGDPDRGFSQAILVRTLNVADEIVGRDGSDILTQGQDILSFEQRTLEVKQLSGEHNFDSIGLGFLTLNWGVSVNSAESEVGDPDSNDFVGGQTSLFYLQNVSGSTLDGIIGQNPAVNIPSPIPDGGYLFGGDGAMSDGYTEDVIRSTAWTIKDEHDAYRADLDIKIIDEMTAQLGAFYEGLEREVIQRDNFLSIEGEHLTTGATLEEFVDSTFASGNTITFDLDSSAFVTREVADQYMQFNLGMIEDLDVVIGARHSQVKMTSSGSSSLMPGFPLTGAPAAFTESFVAGNKLKNKDLLGYGSSDASDQVVSGLIDEEYWLPALSVKYSINDHWALRFSYGQTYALPSPRELSPVFTVDTFTGDRIVGNPVLQPSEIRNLGARLERTFDDGISSFGVSVFHKSIEKPIEQIGLSHEVTGIDVQSYINNENTATILGVELEARIGLAFFDDLFDSIDMGVLQYFSVGGNAAFMDAQVAYPEAVKASYVQSFANSDKNDSMFKDADGNISFPSERRLYDQPEWTLNFDLTFEHPELGTRLTAALYAQSSVLTSVGTGSSLSIDQYTDSYYQLDLTFSQAFGDGWEFSFGVENLTDSSRGVIYGEDLTNEKIERFSYKIGRSYGMSLKYTF